MLNHHSRFRFLDLVGSLLADGQSERDGSAVIDDAVGADFSVVTAQVSLADAQAQAGAFPFFRGEEGIEYVRKDVRRNAAAGVADADLDAVLVCQLAGFDGDASALRSGFGCIQQKV